MSDALEYFIDEQGTNLNSFIIEKEDGTQENVKLYRNANISQQGTPLNAAHLNGCIGLVNNLIDPLIIRLDAITTDSSAMILICGNPTTSLKEGMIIKVNSNNKMSESLFSEFIGGKYLFRYGSSSHVYYIAYTIGDFTYFLNFIPKDFDMILQFHTSYRYGTDITNKPYFELISLNGKVSGDDYDIYYDYLGSGILNIYTYKLKLPASTYSSNIGKINIPYGLINNSTMFYKVRNVNIIQNDDSRHSIIIKNADAKAMDIEWTSSTTAPQTISASFNIKGLLTIERFSY